MYICITCMQLWTLKALFAPHLCSCVPTFLLLVNSWVLWGYPRHYLGSLGSLSEGSTYQKWCIGVCHLQVPLPFTHCSYILSNKSRLQNHFWFPAHVLHICRVFFSETTMFLQYVCKHTCQHIYIYINDLHVKIYRHICFTHVYMYLLTALMRDSRYPVGNDLAVDSLPVTLSEHCKDEHIGVSLLECSWDTKLVKAPVTWLRHRSGFTV